MRAFILIFFLIVLNTIISKSQSIIFVDASATNGLNNGTSWTNAYVSLQTALSSARLSSNVQIWVAKGTYKPSTHPYDISGSQTDRDFTFHLVNGVKIYGGFAGNESAINERIKGNTTILSGDIGVVGNNNDNCYHVVLSVNDDTTTLIDGFTISDGNIDLFNFNNVEGRSIGSRGSGINNTFSSPTITNIVISNNISIFGGMSNSNSSPNISNIIFSNNSGGGMVNFTSSPTVNNAIFIGNYGNNGGMKNYDSSSPYLANILFYNNSTYNSGAGLANLYSSSPTLKNCIFWENKKDGSSNNPKSDIYNSDASLTATFCIFQLPSNNYNTTNQNNITNGYGNLYAQSPLFFNANYPTGNDGIWMTNDDGLQLISGSIGINNGTNIGILNTDIVGNIRPSNGGITDMGAYEFQETCNIPLVFISIIDNYSNGVQLKKTNETIIASNQITGTANVTLRSNKSITLVSGFKAENGTVFKSEIGVCN